jgi:hypothetical protein
MPTSTQRVSPVPAPTEEVVRGSPNLAIGSIGKRFAAAVPLSGLPWFNEFLRRQPNFSRGVREVDDEALELLENLARAMSELSGRRLKRDACGSRRNNGDDVALVELEVGRDVTCGSA